MRHGVGYKKLGRTTAHRRAMFRNMLASLVEHGRIRTTLAKAKALAPGRREAHHPEPRRLRPRPPQLVRRWLPNRDHVKKLFDEIAPRYADRPGGYLRITKLGPRRGDAAELAVIEFVDADE